MTNPSRNPTAKSPNSVNLPACTRFTQGLWSASGTAALLLVAACGSGGSETPASGDQAANVTTNTGTTPDIRPVAAPAAGGPLSIYVGKHPSEAVDGMRFMDEPRVKAAVARNVPDAAVRNFIFNYNGPDAPIVAKNDRILAWGCEKHNCGYHNWSIAITPDGASADICFYQNDDDPDGPATWYLPDGRTEQRPGNCPSE